MQTAQALANRFREVMLNGTWIANTNYQHQLQHLDWQLATTKIGALNTIAVLAQHIHYYINGVKNVLSGGSLEIQDQYSFDFTPFQSQGEWQAFLERLWRDSEAFASLVEQLPEEKLSAFFVDEKYGTYQRNIDGMIEHCYYHLGQISMLRKLLSNEDRK